VDEPIRPQAVAAIYARKSSDDSDRRAEARSTQRQVENATRYARAKGWTVDPRYIYVDDAVSGAEWKHRPGFNAMLAALDPRPPFGVLIVSELSRIGRDTVRTPAAVMQIEEAGVEIRSYLSDAPISLADESSEIHTIFNSLAASFERRRARQRTYDALRRRAEAGAVTGGRVYGYRNQRDGQGYVRRMIDEAEAVIVRQIFALYADGNGLTRIAKRLNAEGAPPPRAGTRSWAPTAVREIIRRELYAGVIVWNRSQKITKRGTKGQRQRPEAEWLRREAPELRIVSTDLWRAVERRRERAATSFPGFTRDGRRLSRPSGADLASPYLLSGLAVCAACGGSLVAMTRPHGTGADRQRVPMYGCVYHQKRGDVVCKNDVVIRQEKLDKAFLEALAESIDDQLLSRAVAKAVERLQRPRPDVHQDRARLAREREQTATSIRHLLDAVKLGRATDTLLAELQVQEAALKALERRIADLVGRRDVQFDGGAVAERVAAVAAEFRATLKRGGPQARRLLQRVLNGRRVPCEPFREAGRRGYRFSAEGIPYAGVMSNDVGGPNGNRTVVGSGSDAPRCVEIRL
jgi:DNA invertase Pin-like site-specific DNA recombinase